MPGFPPHTSAPGVAVAASPRLQPFFFESGDRPIYAVYHPPAQPRPGAPALVSCHTLGVEQVTAYRVLSLAARSAAQAGIPMLRYHARGHGDSGGDFAAVTFQSLVEDALAATAEVRARSGAERVVFLGVRFGALVAAEAMRAAGPIAGLALWEPTHKPIDYFRSKLRDVLFSQVVRGERPKDSVDQLLGRIESEGHVDVHGYYLHKALVESARALELGHLLEGWSGPTLLAQVQRRPSLAPAHAALVRTLEGRGAAVRTLQVNEEPGWSFISNPAWEAEALVRGTTEWLDALA